MTPIWIPLLATLTAAGGCTSSSYETVQVDPLTDDELALDLYLVGDAGQPHGEGDPVLRALEQSLATDTARTFVVFLGDNLYPQGLADSTDLAQRRMGEEILSWQVDVLRRTRTRGIFVPGNHDWQAGGPEGWVTLARQERFLDRHGAGVAALLPEGGCPGPEVRDVGEVLRVVALDTQWWLHTEGPKPLHPDSGCREDREDEVVAAIRGALRTAGDRVTVVVGHHPLVSGGEHGGYFDWPAYLIPGYPFARQRGWFAPQDVNSAEYRAMRASLQRAFAPYPPLVYAAGHEHNLQVLDGQDARYLVVSGTGIYDHTTPVKVLPQTLYADAEAGWVKLSIRRDRQVRLGVFNVNANAESREVYSFWMERPERPTLADPVTVLP